MSGEDAPRPYLEDLIVPKIKTNKISDPNRTELKLGSSYGWTKRHVYTLLQRGAVPKGLRVIQ